MPHQPARLVTRHLHRRILAKALEQAVERIIRHVEEHGFQPSQAEMCREFRITKNAVTTRLKGLADRGVIELPDRNRGRAIRLRYVEFEAGYRI